MCVLNIMSFWFMMITSRGMEDSLNSGKFCYKTPNFTYFNKYFLKFKIFFSVVNRFICDNICSWMKTLGRSMHSRAIIVRAILLSSAAHYFYPHKLVSLVVSFQRFVGQPVALSYSRFITQLGFSNVRTIFARFELDQTLSHEMWPNGW